MLSTYQVRLPQPLTSTEQLITCGARHNKVLGEINAANAIKSTDVWLPRRTVDASQYRAHKPRAEPPLVQTTRDQVRQRLGGDVALFSQPVHVHFVAEGVGDGLDVCGQAGETEEDGWGVVEDFGEVVRYGEGLQAEAEVAGYGDAVFTDHRYAGAAIDVEGRGLGGGPLVLSASTAVPWNRHEELTMMIEVGWCCDKVASMESSPDRGQQLVMWRARKVRWVTVRALCLLTW